MIGNGWYDPLLQYEGYYNFSVNPGNTYIKSPMTKPQQNQMYNAMYGAGNCYDMSVDCNTRGIDEICSYVSLPLSIVSSADLLAFHTTTQSTCLTPQLTI